ncbi:MAG: PQQ-binding-like beta-propeller repeat protein [Verrucomicrobiota bacterium]
MGAGYADSWPQFRGPNADGTADGEYALPSEIGPEKHVLWKVDVPPGVSSPIVHGQHIYLTGVKEAGSLVTFALSIDDGRLLWEQEAPVRTLERTDKKPRGRLATPSVATDGKHVVSFFGSSGLFCYSREGELRWQQPMGPFNNRRGAATSPIIYGKKVIMVQDHEEDSFVAAWDIATGQQIWRTDRMLFSRSYVSPMIWTPDDARPLLVLVGSGLVTFHEPETGRPKWFVQGTAAVPNASPVVGADRLYVVGSNPGPKRSYQLTFAALTEKLDRDDDGQLRKSELPNGLFGLLFDQHDRDGDGRLSSDEYDAIQEVMGTAQNGMIAITAKGEGLDRTGVDVAWHLAKSTPRIASPIFFDGHVYMVKDGGILQSVNAETGVPVKVDRLPAKGKFFSSLVLGDGKLYVADDRGKVCVILAQLEWSVLSTGDFSEVIYATPALVKGRIYLRTATTLYCFGVGKP